jgi:hypothetical protein
MHKVTSGIQFSCDRKLITVFSVTFDFSKAFENVVHSLYFVLNSVLFSDFMEQPVELNRSYLIDRYQCVCVDGKISDLVLVAIVFL